jgi:hypothetical protein
LRMKVEKESIMDLYKMCMGMGDMDGARQAKEQLLEFITRCKDKKESVAATSNHHQPSSNETPLAVVHAQNQGPDSNIHGIPEALSITEFQIETNDQDDNFMDLNDNKEEQEENENGVEKD